MMKFSRKYKDEILQEFINDYEKEFNKSNKKFTSLYNKINEKYNILQSLNNKNKFSIKIEKDRLENIKSSIESNTNAYYIALFAIIVTIVMNFMPNWVKEIFKSFNSNIGSSRIEAMVVLVYLSLVIALVKNISRYSKQVAIYDIAIRVVNNIIDQENEANLKSNYSYSQLTMTMNQAIKDADDTIRKAYESLEEVNRNVKFLEYTTIRDTKK